MRARVLLPQTTRAAGISNRRAIWGIGLSVVLLGAFAYQAQHTRRAVTGDFDRWQTKASTGNTGYGTEDFASFNRWRRNVEQALKDLEAKDQARRQEAAKAQESVDATITANIAAQVARVDLGVGREAAKRRAETSSGNNEDDAGAGAEVANPARTTRDTNGTDGAQWANNTRAGPSWTSQETNLANVPVGQTNVAQAAVSPGLHQGIPWGHMRRHGWGRRYGMGSRLGWGYQRLIGVARAFPYALSVR